MRIGLNLLFLIPGVVGGTETYAVGLVRALARVDAASEFFVFLSSEASSLALTDAPNVRRVVCPVKATLRSARYLWEQAVLPFQLPAYKLDLLHSLGYVGPLFANCPQVVTLPDLNFQALKGVMPEPKRRILEFFSVRSARRAARVITLSHCSKAQIVESLGLDSDKVIVTHLAAPLEEDQTSWEVVQARYGLPDRFVVAVGGASVHKNFHRLIEAFDQVSDHLPHSLVLLGQVPQGVNGLLRTRPANAANRLLLPGYVPEPDKRAILRHADLLVMPSLYEGFGLPVVEAQHAGVPVACSQASSLPEVAGEGALLFDPLSVEQMAAAIRRCLTDMPLRERLIRLGTENLKRFDWERTARETLKVYRLALQDTVAGRGRL